MIQDTYTEDVVQLGKMVLRLVQAGHEHCNPTECNFTAARSLVMKIAPLLAAPELVNEWAPARVVVKNYGVEGATELGKRGLMEWRGPAVEVQTAPDHIVLCPGSEARCLPAVPSAPVAAPPVVVHLPFPEPLETLIDELGKKHICAGDKPCVLGEQARALVEASRQQRRKVGQALATMPITFGFSAAESSLTDAELAEMRRRTDAATKGPWEVQLLGLKWHPSKPYEVERVFLRGPDIRGCEGELWRREDGEFVAHARQDMARLLDEIDRLRNPPAPPAPLAYVPPSMERPDGR